MIAGPNGAGKSTIAPGLLAKALGVVEFVNADVIARGLAGFDPDKAAAAAGRVMLTRLNELASDRTSFAFESTAASRSFAPRIKGLCDAGYEFLLGYVWVSSADISVARVAKRVLLGGHNVPEETIRRRYFRSLANFWNLYLPLADEWQVFDNSNAGNATMIAEGGKGKELVIHGVETWDRITEMVKMAGMRP
jgi:predicted ABC-type ATPase